MRRTNERGDQELFYNQERVLAFDYDSVCTNYDIDLRTMKESVGNRISDNSITPKYPDNEPEQ